MVEVMKMAEYDTLYCVRRIIKDVRTQFAVCSKCETKYELEDIGKYCKEDGKNIEKQYKTPEEITDILKDFVIERFLCTEDGIYFTAFGKKIIYPRFCGDSDVNLPLEDEIKKWEHAAEKSGIKFVKRSKWRLIVKGERDRYWQSIHDE